MQRCIYAVGVKCAKLVVRILRDLRKYRVDLRADPSVPEDYEVVEHRKGGIMDIHPRDVKPYLSERQRQHERKFTGNDLLEETHRTGKFFPNGNLLDDWILHPNHIPWHSRKSGGFDIFLGTIYRSKIDGSLCVRYGEWVGPSYDHGMIRLDTIFGADSCAIFIERRTATDRRLHSRRSAMPIHRLHLKVA